MVSEIKVGSMGQHAERCRTSIEFVCSEIKGLNDTCESEFLDLGHTLSSLHDQLEAIKSDNNSILTLVTGEKLHDATDALHEMVDQVKNYTMESETEWQSNLGYLKELSESILTIIKPLEQFGKTVITLKLIGSYSRIENAGIHNHSDFNDLSERVRQLAETIDSKVESIRVDLMDLKSRIDEAVKKILIVLKTHHMRADRVLQHMQQLFLALEGKQKNFVEGSQVFIRSSEEVRNDISAIVSSLQFQDIIRQKLEHVYQTLEELEWGDSNYAGDDETTLTLFRKNGGIIGLQVLQIKKAREEMLTAMKSFRASIGDVRKNAEKMCTTIRHLCYNSGDEQSTILDNVKDKIDEIFEMVEMNRKLNNEVDTILNLISNHIKNMLVYAKDVVQIGLEIKLIALNGKVQATQLGVQGRTLSVLADHTQQVSEQSNKQIESIKTGLKKLSTLTNHFQNRDSCQTGHLDEKMSPETIKKGLQDILHNVSTIQNAMMEKLDSSMKTGMQITGQIDLRSASIKIDRSYDSVLNTTRNHLSRIFADTVSLTGTCEEASDETVQNLTKRYTMESQREVHADFIVKNKPALQEDNLAQSSETVTSDAGLGDNVELF